MEQIRLDIIPKGLMPVCHSSQYDKGRVIRLNLVDGLQGYTLTDETVTLNVRKPDNNIVTAGVNVISGASYVDIVTTEQMTACEGENLCEIVITKGDVKIASLNFKMKVEVDPLKDGIESETEIHNLETQIADIVPAVVAEQYDSSNVIFDDTPTENHGIGYTVTSEGIRNAIDNSLDMTDTASGAIVTFESEYALPLRDLEIEINAVQSGSGTPSPDNVRPITGFTECNVTRTGKNLLKHGATNTTKNGLTFTVNSDGSFSVNGTTTVNTSLTIGTGAKAPQKLCQGMTYTLSGGHWANTQTAYIQLVYKGDVSGNTISIVSVDRATTYTAVENATLTDIYINFISGKTFNNDIVKPQFELGSTATTYEAYNGTTTPITWQDEAGTVYGGSLDVTTGELTVTWHAIDLGSLTWTYDAGSVPSNPYFFCQRDTVRVSTQNLLCSIYQLANVGVSSMPNYSMKSNNKGQVLIVNHDYSDENTFKTAMSGVVLVCEKLTPETYQLTPTQISVIVGTNNVFTDTNGDTTLEYYTKRGEQTVRIAEGVAVDVINNKNINNLTTTNKTLVGAVNEVNNSLTNYNTPTVTDIFATYQGTMISDVVVTQTHKVTSMVLRGTIPAGGWQTVGTVKDRFKNSVPNQFFAVIDTTANYVGMMYLGTDGTVNFFLQGSGNKNVDFGFTYIAQ